MCLLSQMKMRQARKWTKKKKNNNFKCQMQRGLIILAAGIFRHRYCEGVSFNKGAANM